MAYLVGTQASFTWTGASETLRVGDFHRWSVNIERSVATFKPFGYTSPIRVPTGADAVIDAFIYVDSSTTPPIPTGTQGTLELVLTTGKMYTFSAVAVRLSFQADGEAPTGRQLAVYRFAYSATSSSDVVTAT